MSGWGLFGIAIVLFVLGQAAESIFEKGVQRILKKTDETNALLKKIESQLFELRLKD